jgi:hypothetical protein
VKRGVAIFFLSAYLISLTELNQFVKLPLLVKHFIEHKEKDTNISFLQFLDMHYAQDNVKDADYDEDMKLPFKSHDGCVNASVVVFIPSNFSYSIPKPLSSEKNSYTIYSEDDLNSSFPSSIWQPPKFS